MLRSFISPLIALAVFAAPIMCCCTGVLGLADIAEAQTASVPESPCGHCPSESNSSIPSDQDEPPAPGHSDGCDCEQTIIAASFSAELKLAPAVEVPSFPLLAVIPTESLYGGELRYSPTTVSGEPPGLASRDRLSLLCVLRI